ncbi:pseudouridine synthase [Tribonema minus]|uniref:Pseudouridine synthase n=1 Tax=Tribonema minus TaxID=303371 RepID=A0A836CPN1_9STRA|nr:pseudouridine synthase [Tribonema minus]
MFPPAAGAQGGGGRGGGGSKGRSAQQGAAKDQLRLGSSERLHKVLAHAGVDSRRQCEQMILDGRVRVNGKIVSSLGTRVDPRKDDLLVDGQKVALRSREETAWVAIHKPKGVITSTNDELGRRTVVDLIPGADRMRLLPVGRLDRDSAGLLLLTNDNAWVNVLTHPSYGHEKLYRVAITEGYPSPPAWKKVTEGMMLEGETAPTQPCDIEIISYDERRKHLVLDVVLREGKNRQIRRMFEAIGHPVRAITRLKHGPIGLKQLRPGEWRALTASEVERLKRKGAEPKRGASHRAQSDSQQHPERRAEAPRQQQGGSSAAAPVPSAAGADWEGAGVDWDDDDDVEFLRQPAPASRQRT